MSARVGLASRVAWLDPDGDGGEVVYATTLPDGPPLVLRGPAAVIFLAAADGGPVEEVLDRVTETTDAPAEQVRADVLAFLAQLASLGLVTLT